MRRDIYTSIRGNSKDFVAYLFQHDLAAGNPIAAMRWIGEKYTPKSAAKLMEELDSEDAKPYRRLRQGRIALCRWVLDPIISTETLVKGEGKYYEPKSQVLQQPFYASIMENIDIEPYKCIVPLMGELQLTPKQIESVRAARKKLEVQAAKLMSEEGIPLFGEEMIQQSFPNRDPSFFEPGSKVETKPFGIEQEIYETIVDELTADQKKRFDQFVVAKIPFWRRRASCGVAFRTNGLQGW